MSDLLSLLSLGSAGIAAQNTGISIATNNVANVNTLGYSRQRADLEALPGSPLVGGVRSGAPDRLQDNLLANRIRLSGSAFAMSKAFSEALFDVEHRMTSGTTVDQQLGTLFARIGAATSTPTDASMRDAIIDATRDLVAGIRRRAGELDAAREDANARVKDNIAEASELAERLAQTNLQIARTNDPVARDERDRIASELSEITGGKARIDGDGQMRFVLDGGAVLVDGTHASKLETTTDPTTGDASIAVVNGAARRDVTQQIGGGKVGAEIAFRDGTLAKASQALDQLAFDVGTNLNSVHAANAGLDGVSGRPMFTGVGAVAGAASTIDIDPGLDADPGRLALAAPGAGPGDNRGALALFAMGTAKVATGGRSLTDSAISIVSSIATEAAGAKADVTRDGLVSDHLAGLRDSLAGVDIQEELTNLARFEHASSAMTRFVSTIDDMLGELIDRL